MFQIPEDGEVPPGDRKLQFFNNHENHPNFVLQIYPFSLWPIFVDRSPRKTCDRKSNGHRKQLKTAKRTKSLSCSCLSSPSFFVSVFISFFSSFFFQFSTISFSCRT